MTTASLALMAWMAGTAAYAGQTQPKLTVYLLDRANEQYMFCLPAQALARQMFAAIGVHLEWETGKLSGESSHPPIIIELVSGKSESFKPGSLGYSLPYEGSHITVLIDRVAGMHNRDQVLAHVMVHEITHVLQSISRHSETGVMKERWSARDLIGMRRRPLPFTPQDIELIHSGLEVRAQLQRPVR